MSSNYAKYQTQNPVVRRLIARFLDRIVSLTGVLRPRRIVDLGCGEGFVAEALTRRAGFDFEYRGIELDGQAVARAQGLVPGLRFEQGDLLALQPDTGWADLAISLEVLEHLRDPEAAVAQLRAWTSAWAVVSVPWEPYFRLGNALRGKYLRSLGNHPEHVQQFTPDSLRALLQSQFSAVHVETSFPWLIAVARR